jgi:Zn-dependent membrane protease YugP
LRAVVAARRHRVFLVFPLEVPQGGRQLRAQGTRGRVEAARGKRDPKGRKIALSADVFDQSSAFALAVAAHEVGHALQQKEGYRWFGWWMAVAPYVHILTFVFQMLVMTLAMFFPPIIFLLVISYSLLFLMSILTLPVEYDASRRALKELDRSGLLTTPEEKSAAKTVLIAAGLTYVAKAIQDLLLAVYYALRTFRR